MSILDRYCRFCSKRISLAEADLYNESCDVCALGIIDIL